MFMPVHSGVTCREHEVGERGGCGRLMVACKPTAAADRAEGPLDHPTARLDGKARLPFPGLDDLQGDSSGGTDTIATIGAVGKAVRQEGPEVAQGAQKCDATVAVLQVGWELAATSRRSSVSVSARRLRPTTRRAGPVDTCPCHAGPA